MKLLTTLFIAVLLCLNTVQAQTDMVFKTRNGKRFYVLVHGSMQNDAPSEFVKIMGVKGARRNITIIFEDAALGFVNYSVPTQQATEMHFMVRGNGRGQQIIVPDGVYDCGSVSVPANAIVLDYHPRAVDVQEGLATLPNAPVAPNLPTTGPVTQPDPHNHPHDHPHAEPHPQDPISNFEPAPLPEAPPVYVPGYNGPIGCEVPMHNADFNNARNSVSSKDFESTKLTVAKQIVGANCVTAAQVRSMMSEFSFENTRLTFAKYAYHRTYDVGNYFKVNDAFDFESSVSELSRYISGHH